MRPETIALLRCPGGCGEELSLIAAESANGRVVQGRLLCTICDRSYAIEDGIARLLPGGLSTEEGEPAAAPIDATEAARKRSEMAARDAQVESYDKMRGLALFGKLEIPITLAQLN